MSQAHSRDIYHTKRMQRLTCAAWSLDDRFIYSGSDEMNIRIWKARAAEKLGVVSSLLHTFLFGSASLQYAKIVCFVYFRLNLERGQLCKSTLNWLKNSSTIQLSKRFNVTDKIVKNTNLPLKQVFMIVSLTYRIL